MKVRAKKGLGQHFLRDRNIAEKITRCLKAEDHHLVIEIGPGTGILTGYLLAREDLDLHLVELDKESVDFLMGEFPQLAGRIHHEDFLHFPLDRFGEQKIGIIGNFPYYISSQILFRVLEYRDRVVELVGMLQKEVAERIAAGPGSRSYGILSVLLQAYYRIDYLFTVGEKSFSPPPRVKSGVIRMKRNQTMKLACDEDLFFRVVKTAFNQRRKILRNSLKTNFVHLPDGHPLLQKRPEELTVFGFVELTNLCADAGS